MNEVIRESIEAKTAEIEDVQNEEVEENIPLNDCFNRNNTKC